MENPYELLEQRIAGIENLLLTMLNRIDEIKKPTEEEYGDINDCVRWIKRSKSTIYTLVSGKKIPHIKNGKRLLFNKEEIFEWLNAGTRHTLSEIQDEIDQNLQSMGKSKFGA